MAEHLTCLLCGQTDRDVIHTWVRWKETVDGKAFGTVYRCKDRGACIRRVEANGEAWPVADGSIR